MQEGVGWSYRIRSGDKGAESQVSFKDRAGGRGKRYSEIKRKDE